MMKNRGLAFAVLLVLASVRLPAEPAVPFADGECLRYVINWPSGLSLGEAEFSARLHRDAAGAPKQWEFTFQIDAAMPGFRIEDRYHSLADANLCSRELEKNVSHGRRKAHEKTTFDQEAHLARRVTLGGGGTSNIETGACAMDGLTFLYHLRRELSHGRIPPPRTVLFGAAYQVRLQFVETSKVQLGGKTLEADQMTATVKGPASESTFLILVARDPARTPVRITVPLEPGNFSMELAPE